MKVIKCHHIHKQQMTGNGLVKSAYIRVLVQNWMVLLKWVFYGFPFAVSFLALPATLGCAKWLLWDKNKLVDLLEECGVDLMPFTATGETRVWISEPGYNITKCRAQDEMGCRSLMALYETEIKRWWGNSSDCRSSWAHISLKEHGENSYRRSSLKKQGRAVVC